MTDDELTYAKAGVDIEASEAATAALIDSVQDIDTDAFAGFIDIGDRYLALTTDGVGTKLLVAAAIDEYSTIGIDCIAMNVNDLVAAGFRPVAFVDYLAVESPDETLTKAIGEGLATGAEQASVNLVGGETAVMPEVIRGFDLAGACLGITPKDGIVTGHAEPTDQIVGWESTGIHSNGLTLARKAVTKSHDYTDPFPGADRTIGEELLRPTKIYTDLYPALQEHSITAAAHITGGGWTNLTRLGDHKYEITSPPPVPAVFEFIQQEGNISPAEMYNTFNMGLGFVATAPAEEAKSLASTTDGKIIGNVTTGSGIHSPSVTIP